MLVSGYWTVDAGFGRCEGRCWILDDGMVDTGSGMRDDGQRMFAIFRPHRKGRSMNARKLGVEEKKILYPAPNPLSRN